jgi:hypothetical protein
MVRRSEEVNVLLMDWINMLMMMRGREWNEWEEKT